MKIPQLILALTIGSICATAKPVRLVPMEDFFRNPESTSYQISPDGEHISWLAPYENRLNVHVRAVREETAHRLTKETDRDIRAYFWVNNQRLVYLQDKAGDENFQIFAVNLDGSGFQTLTPEGVRAGIIDDLKEDPDHMLITLNQRDARLNDLYRLNVTTGDSALLVENPGNFIGYTADHEGTVRFTAASDGVNVRTLYRPSDDAEWEEVIFADWMDEFNVVNFTYDNEKVWAMSSIDRDKVALVLWNPETRKEEKVIYSHPQVDLLSAHFSDVREKLTSISFLAAYRTFVFFDPETEKIQDKLKQRLAPAEIRLAGSSRDESKLLILTFSDKNRGSYYFYDVEEDELIFLAEQAPWLDSDEMADVEPICYESRDGLFIHGYLTLPKGVPAKDLPLIVHPHGGPQARDSWGFRPTAQFLANRGYAVLQPNFRGSTGYGKQFTRLGFREWGKKMQDDLTDGVNYLVNRGIVDPEKVGIYGGSYGGYATLAGLAFTPDVYAAGASYVGPSNLFTLLESIPPYWEPFREMLYEMVGNPDAQSDIVRDASPLFFVDQIDDPLLILQGANDPRVKQAESDQIVRALRLKNIPVPYMLKENEGHGFSNEENQFHANRAVEQFFHRYLGGKAEEAEDVLSPLYKTEIPEEEVEPEAEK